MATIRTPLIASYSAQERQRSTDAIKKRSFLPGILAIELIFTILWILNGLVGSESTITTHEAAVMLIVPMLQGIYGSGIVWFGQRLQWFAQDSVFGSLPMIWLPLFPIILQTMVFLWQWPAVTKLLLLSSSWKKVVALQGIRSLAVGSLIKWRKGLFPTAFAWGTGFPDMLFGLSAWLMLVLLSFSNLETHLSMLMYWNAVRLAIILPVGVLNVQLGMSPTQLYNSRAPYKLVFEYPMVLSPAIVVPILLSWNFVLIKFALDQ